MHWDDARRTWGPREWVGVGLWVVRLLGVEDWRRLGCMQSDDEGGMVLLLAFDGWALLRGGAREADADC